MFELTVSINSGNQKYIHELYKKLYDEVKKDSGIAIKQNFCGRSYFALAVSENKKEYYKSKILDYIVFIIIDCYKFEFYKETLETSSLSVLIQPFLKAISIFDAETDREVITKTIELSGEVLVDSFFFFKLGILKNRWARTADIICKNQIMENETSMIDILRYLTLMSENSVLASDIAISKKQIKLKNFAGSHEFKRDKNGEEEFLTEIVRLNPAKLNVKLGHGISENDEIYNFLNEIFADKIYLV